jgi:hypothetical protein
MLLMGKPKKEDMVRYSHWEVTPNQHEFLDKLSIIGDVRTACKESGYRYEDLQRCLMAEDTPFKRAYESILKKLDGNFNFSKYRNLHDLDKMRDRMLYFLDRVSSKEDDEKFEVMEAVQLVRAASSVIEQMNKMVEGNLAATKKVTEHKELKLSGVIDMTKKRNIEIEDVDIIDE